MIKIKYIMFLLLFSFCNVYSHNYYDLKNPKEKIAILQVKDNSKESGASFSLYSTDFSSVIENSIRGSIHNKLFNSKYFSVVNKSQINKLAKEHKFTLSNLLTKKAQIDIPALKKLNVNKGLIISITEFKKEEQKRVDLLSVGINAAAKTNLKDDYTKSIVSIILDVSLIDIETGDIIFADNFKSKSSIDDWHEEGFNEKVMSKAYNKISSNIVKKIVDLSKEKAWKGIISSVSDDNTAIINCGSLNGLEVGMEFELNSVEDDIIDPNSGQIIGKNQSYGGRVKIINTELADGNASKCEILELKDIIKVNDYLTIPKDVTHSFFRFYHKKNKDHYYTKNSNPKGKWVHQGIEFYAYLEQLEGTIPIYQFYHKKNKDHFYTKNPKPKGKWKSQGIGFYAYQESVDGTVPIHRFYHIKNKDHFYTKNPKPKGKWKNQGIEFYAFPNPE